jgi:hypothetical protein
MGIIALELDLLVDESLPGEEVVDPPGLVHVYGGEAARLAQPQSCPLFTLRTYTFYTTRIKGRITRFFCRHLLWLHGPNN